MMSDCRLIGVPTRDLESAWPFVEEMLFKGIEKVIDEFNIQDLYKFIVEKKMQLWTARCEIGEVTACAVTEVQDYPQVKICRIVLLVGEDMDTWLSLEDGIATWAGSIGCTRMEAFCRSGLKKVLPDIGYKQTHIVMSKEIAQTILH